MADDINKNSLIVIERSQVAPPPGCLPSTTTLPLTFFDIPFFCCLVPVQRIFFYDFPYSTIHFLQTTLPILKHSLSLSLQHFFPFVSNLIVPPQQPHLSHIRYLDGDSLSFTVAEYSTADFNLLTSDSPQDVRSWLPLVPTLPSPRVEQDGTRVFSLMAIQVTVFPNSGFSLCLTFNHVACDGKSLHHFIKFWASLCKLARVDMDMSSLEIPLSLPSHERDKVNDPKGLKNLYIREPGILHPSCMDFARLVRDFSVDKVRFSVVLSLEQVHKLKKWVSLKYGNTSQTLHISTFVVTCSLLCVCMIRSNESKLNPTVAQDCDELGYLVFLADCRDYPEFSLPSTYFGNCLVYCIVAIKKNEVVEENGIVEVAKAIERRVRDFKIDALAKAETMLSDYIELQKSGKVVAVVGGSPKLNVYETDFGWGKPKKSDAVHMNGLGISLSDRRDKEGGIAVGLVLEKIRMNNFTTILAEQLNVIYSL